MATATINITSTDSLVYEYTVVDASGAEDTASLITIVRCTYKSTSSSGAAAASNFLLDFEGLNFSGAVVESQSTTLHSLYTFSVTKGTKSKTVTLPSKWLQVTKGFSAKSCMVSIPTSMTVSGVTTRVNGKLSFTIPARTSYEITLDAAGGTPATQVATKWHGFPHDLTTGFTVPTRQGYLFYGWSATQEDAAAWITVSEYTGDEDATFYASWKPAIENAGITSIDVVRVDNSSSTAESDDGEYCYGRVGFSMEGEAAGTVGIVVTIDPPILDSNQDPITPTFTFTKQAGLPLSDVASFHVPGCDLSTKYLFTATATFTNSDYADQVINDSTLGDYLSIAFFTWDALGDGFPGQRPGHGFAFGQQSVIEGLCISMDFLVRSWAGVIQMFAGSTPPAGWLLCDGSAVSRTTYATLYAAIGDTWGAGDGSTTFNLPDLRGRTVVGVDPNGSIDSYTESSNMLLTDTAIITQEQYLAYKLKLSGRSLAANTRYTLQLFDVHISHSGKTETTIGLGIFWGGGGSVNHLATVYASPDNDGETTLKSYTSNGNVYAYCKHLTVTLDTTGKTQAGNELWIYNSPNEVSGTRLVEIGRWMLNAEADGALSWEPRRYFHRYGAYDLGTSGGIDHPDIQTVHMPSHTHNKGTLAITASGSHNHKVKGYGNYVAKGSNYYRYGSSGDETANIGMTSETHTHPNANFSGNTGSTGGNNSFDIRSAYAVVNYIIHTGKVS